MWPVLDDYGSLDLLVAVDLDPPLKGGIDLDRRLKSVLDRKWNPTRYYPKRNSKRRLPSCQSRELKTKFHFVEITLHPPALAEP